MTTANPCPAVPDSEETLHYAAQGSVLTVRRAYCKACDLCLEACPANILTLDDADRIAVTNIGRCTFCGLCAARCPDFVFVLEPKAEPIGDRGPFRLTAARGG